MIQSISLLIVGVVLAWFGGTLFVGGSVGLAKWARWPAAVIGVTVAAFGTSAPELMVAVHAAVDGVPEISLGDVLGSNVVNIALILAVVLAMSGMRANDSGIKRDWISALAVPAVLAAVLWDGWFSRVDAAILLILFFFWLIVVIRHARRHAHSEAAVTAEALNVSGASRLKTVGLVVLGLALLVVAAQLVVHGGRGTAELLGLSPLVVGAVVVSVATSTPELATTIVSRMKGHDDIGLGNILGSNIFNALFIAAVAALIQPYAVNFRELVPALVLGAVTTLMVLPGRGGYIGRSRGFMLLALYSVFVVLTLRAGH